MTSKQMPNDQHQQVHGNTGDTRLGRHVERQIPTTAQKLGELELLLLATEAVVGEMEEYCDGENGPPHNRLHALQIAAAQLLDSGLRITGVR